MATLQTILKYNRIAAFLIVPLLVGLQGWQYWQVVQLQDNLDDSVQKLTKTRRTFTETKADIDALPLDIDKVTDIAELYETLNVNTYAPLPLIQSFYEASEGKFLVDKFTWEADDYIKTLTAEEKNNNRNRRRGNNDKEGAGVKALPVELAMDGYFAANYETQQVFLNEAKTLLENIDSKIADYTLVHDKLPGLITEKDRLEINLGADAASIF